MAGSAQARPVAQSRKPGREVARYFDSPGSPRPNKANRDRRVRAQNVADPVERRRQGRHRLSGGNRCRRDGFLAGERDLDACCPVDHLEAPEHGAVRRRQLPGGTSAGRCSRECGRIGCGLCPGHHLGTARQVGQQERPHRTGNQAQYHQGGGLTPVTAGARRPARPPCTKGQSSSRGTNVTAPTFRSPSTCMTLTPVA